MSCLLVCQHERSGKAVSLLKISTEGFPFSGVSSFTGGPARALGVVSHRDVGIPELAACREPLESPDLCQMPLVGHGIDKHEVSVSCSRIIAKWVLDFQVKA